MIELTIAQKKTILEEQGFTCGPRDPRLNTNYPGNVMVVEEHDEKALPTKDGSNGPWCIVGDDLDALVMKAFEIADGFLIARLDKVIANYLARQSAPQTTSQISM